jgi:Tol biopolymer transport system component
VGTDNTEPSGVGRPAIGASGNRLESWKEIASYLRRDVTTVQRWEKREGMPVHRHLHDRLGSVYAYGAELDEWLAQRSPRRAQEPQDGTQPVDSAATSAREFDSAPPAVERRWRWAFVLAAGGLGLVASIAWLFLRTEPRWPAALEQARYQAVTDFDGIEQAAAVSRDGRLVAFVSDRDGQLDVWVTQLGTGQFHNLTRGRVRELVNPSVRTLGFSPDAALVTFWARGVGGSASNDIGVWAISTFGGEPRPYLEGVAEFEWSRDASRLVYHTPGPGDPTFIRDAQGGGPDRQIFAAPPGMHAHFPTWSPDGAFIYFAQGTLPDALDLYRITPSGDGLERLTHHNAGVSHPVLLDDKSIAYLVREKDSLGGSLHLFDLEERRAHTVGAGFERYTSLSAGVDGNTLIATLASPKGTLGRLHLADSVSDRSTPEPLALPTGRGSLPRLGPGFLLYVARKGTTDSIWKLKDGAATEVWSVPGDARIVGGPELDDSGGRIAVVVEQRGNTRLYAMNADGLDARVVSESLPLRGSPAWEPGGRSLVSAVDANGTRHLFRISLDGSASRLVAHFASDPASSPDGKVIAYTGADIGTKFEVKAATGSGGDFPIPPITLPRGSRRLRFVQGGRALVFMRGDLHHKNLWLIDLQTGAERQLTNLPPDFDVRDFDISADGREIVVERLQEHSDVVMIDLSAR